MTSFLRALRAESLIRPPKTVGGPSPGSPKPQQPCVLRGLPLPLPPPHTGGFLMQDISFQQLEVPSLHTDLKGCLGFG